MLAPRMVIVGGPSGAGKSSVFSIYDVTGAASFGTDDYCAALNGRRLGRQTPVYAGIPPDIRLLGGIALQNFIGENIAAGKSFTFETTLREFTFEQARRAAASGFWVEMLFVAAGPVEEHIERVKSRADAGGHSASEGSLREIYERGMRFLVTAFEENRRGNIHGLSVYHNPPSSVKAEKTPRPTLIIQMLSGCPDLTKGIAQVPPPWFQAAVRGTDFELEKLRGLDVRS
ncbi:MAG: hypothetical protein EXQ57_07710 [Bryobacterales bacterium]|nr:hypothetical protein [Bryobacterales bacterium]